MQELLSYDQSPPIAAPFRFFLSAPVFTILAGLVLAWAGPDAFASRWTPGILASTHLVTVGFMLQVMLGALIQIFPVVIGANMKRPLWVGAIVHLSICFGAVFLAAAFFSLDPYWFAAASLFLGGGTAYFLVSAALALFGIPAVSPTVTGLKISLVGLVVTVVLGVLMTFGFSGKLDLPLLQLADVHLAWGFVAWGLMLLAAVAYVVVPMFQLTPSYPRWCGREFLFTVLGVVVLWSVCYLIDSGVWSTVVALGVIVACGAFAVVTLSIQRKTKRPSFDATQHYWRFAMLSILAACGVWGAATAFPTVGEWPGWPLACGVLIIFGGFVSVISGMLYKIVPFLIWLHLQNQGQGRLMAPNMKKIIAEAAMRRQMQGHLLSCLLLLLAVVWPDWFVYPSAAAIVLAQAGLFANLLAGVRVFRAHQRRLAALAS